jgi:hypothetical protein
MLNHQGAKRYFLNSVHIKLAPYRWLGSYLVEFFLSRLNIWWYGRGWGQGGEITQALYAHMNNKKKRLNIYLHMIKPSLLFFLNKCQHGSWATCTEPRTGHCSDSAHCSQLSPGKPAAFLCKPSLCHPPRQCLSFTSTVPVIALCWCIAKRPCEMSKPISPGPIHT